jgi:hypothetical protein
VLQFEYDMSSRGSRVECWLLAGSDILGSSRNFKRWGLAGGSRSLWDAFEGYNWPLVQFSFSASCLPRDEQFPPLHTSATMTFYLRSNEWNPLKP